MTNNATKVIAMVNLAIVLIVVTYFLTGPTVRDTGSSVPVTQSGPSGQSAPVDFSKLEPGATVDIDIYEKKIAPTESHKAADVKSSAGSGTYLGAGYDPGALEAASANKGGTIEEGGDKVTWLGNIDRGILSRIVKWFKFWIFWIVVSWVVALGLSVLVPPLAPYAIGYLRLWAALIPFFGSLLERGIGQKRFSEVVAGGESFKNSLDSLSVQYQMAPGLKDAILLAFESAHKGAQDASTQTAVKALIK